MNLKFVRVKLQVGGVVSHGLLRFAGRQARQRGRRYQVAEETQRNHQQAAAERQAGKHVSYLQLYSR